MNKDNIKQAQGIFKNMPEQKSLFLNKKGEFFTNENYCQNSVSKKSDYEEVKRSSTSEDAPNEQTPEEKAAEAKRVADAAAEAKAKEDAAKEAVKDVTVESLKEKGEELPKYLKDFSRDELNALSPLFDFSIEELQNKTECIDKIVDALTEKEEK